MCGDGTHVTSFFLHPAQNLHLMLQDHESADSADRVTSSSSVCQILTLLSPQDLACVEGRQVLGNAERT